MMNQTIFSYMKKFMAKLIIQPMVFHHNSSVENLYKSLDVPLEKKRKGIYGPAFNKKVIYVIDDLNLGGKLIHKNKPSVHEVLRQYLDH
jgi:hypothetical protein